MYISRMKNGKECEVYTYEEIKELTKVEPPKYCSQDATELQYYAFYDSLDRFTIKAGCPKCMNSQSLPQNEESYHKNMLKHWTKRVKNRADNRCEMADENCKGDLHAHHIIPKHLAPSRQYDVTNGLCLCEAHHKMIHRYM